MGREWLYWIGARPRRPPSAGNKEYHTSSPGCMCAVFHLFHLHHIHLPLNHQHSLPPFLQQQSTSSKGVEAPRNSLELEEPPAVKLASNPQPMKQQQENLNFPPGIQIKTRTSISASECSMDSPGTKTPNLVARLMGLDLLPETNSPSSSTSNSKPQTKSHLNQTNNTRCFYDDDINVGARLLPETSRIEFHRLSLQIHKDNANEEFAVSSKTARGRFRQDENRSPRHYAKQIVKQVRESVSRRVGLDITNTNRDEIRRDQNLLLKLSKKNSNDTKQSTTPSCSPKLRILENKKNRNSTSSDTDPSKPKQPATNQEHQFNKLGKKLSPQTYDQAIRSKKEETFVRSPAASRVNLTDKKSKKAPLSNELLRLSGPTILPVKKGPSPPATKLPQKQAQVSDALSSKRNTQLSSNTSRSYKQLPLHPDKIFTVPENVLPDSTNGCATTPSASAAEYKFYIQNILKRAGIIDNLTPLTLGKWHTPSHPLDPSIFYYLELFHPAAAPSASTAGVLTRRCNRKLIFQLVDELLVDILRPHLDYKPWASPVGGNTNHFVLADELCKKIESFPAAYCQVLEDIDFLIDEDLRKSPLNGYFEEEGERLVREIAGEIVERLVSETVAVAVVDGVRTGRQSGWMSRGELSRDEMPLIGVCGNHPRRQHVYQSV